MIRTREISTAADRARQWLAAIAPASTRVRALRTVGVSLCDFIAQRASFPPFGLVPESCRLPSLEHWVTIRRNQLLAMSQAVTLCGGEVLLPADDETCAQFIGALALSYGHTGDISVVASLVRMAAHISLDGVELTTA